MRAAPPQHPSIARALGPARAAMLAGLASVQPRATAGHTVVVGVSGGADSMATLGLLELLSHGLALRLVVACVDHGLRPGSAAEAALVVATARARGHAVWTTRLDLAIGAGLAARARAARRAALLDAAATEGATAIVLGHTQTDQAETVLLNLTRGATLGGLAAMSGHSPWEKPQPGAWRRSPGVWIRPMLHLARGETRALAVRLGLPFVDDPGNDDVEQPRVRIRKRVLAELAAINPRVEAHLAAAANAARAALGPSGEDLDGTSGANAPSDAGDRSVTIDAAQSGRAGAPEVRALVLRLCREAGLEADSVAQRTLDGIVAAIAAGRRARHRWDLRGAVLHHDAGRLWVEPRTTIEAAADPTIDPP